jgi:membrane associated rhomboid family serine protease
MFRSLTPVVRALLYTNLIVYVAETLTGDTLLNLFALWPLNAHALYGAPPFEPWQLVTYAFLHGGWLHLFSNMLALYMFGPDTERVLGSRRFTQYYFACAIGAALTQMIVMRIVDPGPTPTLGASGAIFGILLFYGMAFPRRTILLLFLPIPMPAWLFVTLYGIFELVQGVSGTAQGVAHFAHLGGLATGFLVIQYWRRQTPRDL